jgi:hypothetical protein
LILIGEIRSITAGAILHSVLVIAMDLVLHIITAFIVHFTLLIIMADSTIAIITVFMAAIMVTIMETIITVAIMVMVTIQSNMAEGKDQVHSLQGGMITQMLLDLHAEVLIFQVEEIPSLTEELLPDPRQ